MLMAMLILSGCLNDDKVVTTSECAIVSFSVGSITSSVVTKKYDSQGNATDTVVSRTIAGSGIYFNIDQVDGYIHTIDSLPNWTNLEKVVPSFTSYGSVYVKVPEEDIYYSITSGSDSVDFTKTVELMCISTDGTAAKYYKADIYKRLTNSDTLEWKELTSNLSIKGGSRVFYTDDKVFLFAQNADGEDVVTFAESNDAKTWSVPVAIPVDDESVVLWQGVFYGLDEDGIIYSSTPDELAAEWTQASDEKVERLLAADEFYLYAFSKGAIIGSKDLQDWSVQGVEDLDMLPEQWVNALAYTADTHMGLNHVVMAGISSYNNEFGVTWYKMASADETVDQPWAYIQVTPDNPYGMPHFDCVSMTYYKEALFAIGMEDGEYKDLYRSDDNGITWHPQTEMYPVPKTLDGANGVASIVAVDTKLWIVQENGTIWQGSIQ